MSEGLYYREFFSLKSIFYFCSVPLRLDSYKGCSFGCLYCFSQNLNNRQNDFFRNIIPADISLLKKRFENINKWVNRNSIINSCLRRRIPIHFGSVSDPFQPIEKKYHVSYDFLNILAENNYPIIISTKSTLIKENKYLNVLKKLPVAIQISFSSFDDEISKRIEPYAPSLIERIECLRFLANHGFYTVARIQPFLFANEINIESKIELLHDCGVKHIILEHLRIPTNSSLQSRVKLWENIGKDYLALYKMYGIKKSRINYELNEKIKINNVLKIKNICHEFGISFGSGDNDLHHMSDHFCCCGNPQIAGFDNFYDGHLNYIAYNAIKNGEIDLSSVFTKWHPSGSIREYMNSDCRIKEKRTMKEYIIERIRDNRKSNSLDSFFGIEFDPLNGYYINQEIRNMIISNKESKKGQ